MLLGAAISSSRSKKRAAAQSVPTSNESADQSDMFEQLEKLAALKDKGILTQDEFDAKKKQILGL